MNFTTNCGQTKARFGTFAQIMFLQLDEKLKNMKYKFYGKLKKSR